MPKKKWSNTTSRSKSSSSRGQGASHVGRVGALVVAERTLSRRAACIKNSKCPTPSGQRLPAINAKLCYTHTHIHSLLSTILYGLYVCVCVLLSVSATLLCCCLSTVRFRTFQMRPARSRRCVESMCMGV